MKKITLDEMIAEVQAIEKNIHEEQVVTNMIWTVTAEVAEAAKGGKVTILSDYDADGICSAYIMEHTLKALNPDCDIAVEINDRRGQYGLSPNVQGDADRRYIVCDMGSNQLDLARERLGDNVIIIDHHLIENEEARRAFDNQHKDCYNTEKPYAFLSKNNKCLCNPHAVHKNDNENAQYCATGLAYRVYETAIAMENSKVMSHGLKVHHNETLDNTMLAVACIGTATDMVNVLDQHSNNREILKKGCEVIDNADLDNFDYIIGNILERNGIKDNVTAHQLAFNVGAFFNSASRMSELAGENGGQVMYNALVSPVNSDTFRELDRLSEQNATRKSLMQELTSEDSYKQFIYNQRIGDNKDDNIAVYQLPDDVPHTFAGLVAGKLAEATDKAIICVVYNTEKNNYSGSARNVASNETNLKTFLDYAVSKEEEIFGDTRLQMKYGGHEDAVGISALCDIERLRNLIDETKGEMKAKAFDDRTILALSLSELSLPETLEKVQALEPTGIGLQLPVMEVRGVETYREGLHKQNREEWKAVRITDPEDKKNKIDISDWSYNSENYPQTGAKSNEIALIAEVGISDFRGIHLELTAKPDRAFDAERRKEVELENAQKEDKAVKKAAITQKGDE